MIDIRVRNASDEIGTSLGLFPASEIESVLELLRHTLFVLPRCEEINNQSISGCP